MACNGVRSEITGIYNAKAEGLPDSTSSGQTHDRVAGGVKGFINGVVSLAMGAARFLGAPSHNTEQVESFLHFDLSSKNQQFGDFIGTAAVFLFGGGEGKAVEALWHEGSFGSVVESLAYHFGVHGAELGATSDAQYLRKAVEFAKNLKGATRQAVEGPTEGVVRYSKNSRYIDLAPDGRIVSFGAK
jgi:hypothetical protein